MPGLSVSIEPFQTFADMAVDTGRKNDQNDSNNNKNHAENIAGTQCFTKKQHPDKHSSERFHCSQYRSQCGADTFQGLYQVILDNKVQNRDKTNKLPHTFTPEGIIIV